LKKKKPDAVVWDETHETYFAKLLPYASSLSGPIIEVPNVDAFKKKGVDKVSKQFQAELTDLQEKIKSFVSLAADTQQVYNAHFKFEPIVGETYYLYQGLNNTFLSLIEPSQWKQKHLGTFRLNSDYKWERL
jgi:hypothetical protein